MSAIDNLFVTGPYLKVANGGTGAGTAATAATNLGLGTGDSPQFTAVNIGHASDTTITRSAAGVLAVEGGVIPKENRANTFTANQVIEVTDNSNPALRITQLGSGEAFRVEDSSNPDATPVIIDASGKMGVGGAAAANFDVVGGSRVRWDVSGGEPSQIASNTAGGAYAIQNFDALSFVFKTSNTARIYVDSNGKLGVGTSSMTATANFVSASDAVYVSTTGTTSTCSYWKVGSDSGCYYSLFQNTAGSNIGWIRTTDGSTVQYYTGSDERLKTNIQPAVGALATLAAVHVRSYEWKATGAKVNYGFIAQELVDVSPDAVSIGKDTAEGEIDVPWGVDYAKLVPLLVAGLQELKAEFDAYKAAHP